MSDDNFLPIGYKGGNYSFQGTYDGQGYTISGLSVTKERGSLGFFGMINGATVKNVVIVSPTVRATQSDNKSTRLGSLIGVCDTDGANIVENCHIINPTLTIDYTGSEKYLGAIIGKVLDKYTTVRNCYYYGSNDYALVGHNDGILKNVAYARKVTAGENVSIAAPDATEGFTYDGNNYYREGMELALGYNGDAPADFQTLVFCANGTQIDGSTYAVNSTNGDATVTAKLGVPYIDADGNKQICANYTVLTNATDIDYISEGWYVVSGNVNYSSQLTCGSGDLHLILCDGAKMSINVEDEAKAIFTGGALAIYAQSTGNSMGQLEAISNRDNGIMAIGNITICGGNITATGCSSSGCSGIFADNITIRGGKINAAGDWGIRANGDITLGLRSASDFIIANKYCSAWESANIASGQTLYDEFGNAYSGTLTINDFEIDAIAGKTLRLTPSIALANNADNSTIIDSYDGNAIAVKLKDRTLYKDGKWNTICLPFDVTLSGSPLEGATARTLTAASINGTTLNLTFGSVVTDKLVAGTPYIIKWPAGDNIVEPVFAGVTMTTAKHDFDNGESGDQRVRFIGTYNATTFENGDNSVLIMGGGNTLYYPNAGAGLGAQRAYFKIGDDDAALARPLTAFSISFGDEVTTGIISIENGQLTNENSWYTVDGRRLTQKPAQRGMYINGGKKVIVK